MSFVQFFRILWARRWIIIAATVSCFIAAVAIGSLLPVRYTSTSRVMLDVVKPDPVTGQVMGSQFARTYFQTQSELIRDYRIAGAVVDDLGWTSSPQLLARYNNRGPGDNRDFRRYLAQIIIDSTKVDMVQGSNILEISYTSNDPENARAVADAVRKAYIDQSIAFKRESAASTAEWLDQQVTKVRSNLSTAENRKASFERQNDIVLQDNDMDLDSARLAALAAAPEAPPVSAAAAAAATTPSSAQLAQMDARIKTAAESLGPNNPDLIDLKRQRDAIAATVAAERRAMTTPAAIAGPSVSGQVRAQTAKVLGQRDKLEQLRALQADVVVLRDQYAKTSAKAAEAHQSADSNDAGLTPLGNAVAPTDPVFPNWPLILIGSLGLGLALGVLASLITELLSRRVRGVEDLSGTGVPVIAVLYPMRDQAMLGSRQRRLPFFSTAATSS